MDIVKKFYKKISQEYQSGPMLKLLPGTLIASQQLTLLPEDILVNHLVLPGSEKARQMTATSGRLLVKSLPTSGPLGACLKMLLGTSLWGSTQCYLTWKVRDTPAKRLLFQLAPSMPRISGNAYGFWHTPNVPNGGRVNPLNMTPTGKLANGKKRQVGLEHQVRMVEKGFWPTPMAQDAKNSTLPPSQRNRYSIPARLLKIGANGQLNPEWVEWLMGFPVGWTELKP